LVSQVYKHSAALLLANAYPEYNYEWLPWKFNRLPPFFWDDVKNQRKFVDWVGKVWKIKEKSDWYTVTPNVVLHSQNFLRIF
jgi:hypothetical protein